MKRPIHVIYLSGLGDDLDRWRLRALKLWRFRGVSVELVPMTWRSGTFEQKLARIDRACDRASGKRIVIIGESAGGSMAVHTYARRDDLYKVMTLCGKNSHPETVAQQLYHDYPAFGVSMNHLEKSLSGLTAVQRKEFVSIHPLHDPVVPVHETLLPGCREVRLWSYGHFTTIALALTVFAPVLVHAAKAEPHG